jgi:hypothetical protein
VTANLSRGSRVRVPSFLSAPEVGVESGDERDHAVETLGVRVVPLREHCLILGSAKHPDELRLLRADAHSGLISGVEQRLPVIAARVIKPIGHEVPPGGLHRVSPSFSLAPDRPQDRGNDVLGDEVECWSQGRIGVKPNESKPVIRLNCVRLVRRLDLERSASRRGCLHLNEDRVTILGCKATTSKSCAPPGSNVATHPRRDNSDATAYSPATPVRPPLVARDIGRQCGTHR